MTELGFYKLHPDVVLPKMATAGSACFDLAYFQHTGAAISGHDLDNNLINVQVHPDGSFNIFPFQRLLVPTGLIMDIPRGFSVRVHPRSGLSIKSGLILANMEGVIDSDYVDEVFITLFNFSNIPQTIPVGMRLAQAELIESLPTQFVERVEKPGKKTDRIGGLGSTGH